MAVHIPYPVIDMVKTGKNIKRLREERDITVMDIQHFLNLANPQAIYQWQKGISLPTVDHLCALSHLFGTSMDEIIILADFSAENQNNAMRHNTPLALFQKFHLLVAA